MRTLTGRSLVALISAALIGACGGSESSLAPTGPATITLTASGGALDAIGAPLTIIAKVLDGAGTAVASPSVTWTSSNTAVATVTTTGTTAVVAAKSNGTATITAVSGSATSSVTVTVKQVVTRLSIASGDLQIGPASTALAQPIVVQAVDRLGGGVAGIAVTLTPQANSGTLAQTSGVTAADGTFATTWTLGSTQAVEKIDVVATGIAGVTFTGVIGTPASSVLSVKAGDNQAAFAGTAVTNAPSVMVSSVNGQPKAGVTVTFAVTSGGGTLSTTTATSAANGIATAGTWTLGSTAQANVVTATAASAALPAVFTSAGCTTNSTTTAYEITLCFRSAMTTNQRNAFLNASAKWSSVVTGDLPSAVVGPVDSVGTACPSSSELNMNVDDIVIFATVQPIDGVNGILGQTGICQIRDTGFLPYVAFMKFDDADLDALDVQGTLGTTILHEMGHALGIGSLWNLLHLTNNPSTSAVVNDTYFSGTNAIAAFDAVGGTSYSGKKVPIENLYGPGTINVHWRYSVMKTELMSGFIGSTAKPLSLVSVRSLQDLGYAVNVAAADSYSLAGGGLLSEIPSKWTALDNDVVNGPIYTRNKAGKRIRLQ